MNAVPGDEVTVVVPEFLPEAHLERLREWVRVVYEPDLHADRPRLLEVVGDAVAILIRNRTIVDEELLSSAPRLAVIGRLGVGLDNIDLAATQRHDVKVYPAHGGNAISVAEYVIGAMLVLQRRVFDMTDSMRRGQWPRQGHAFGHELHAKTLGLIGLGAIAREVATRAAGFGMSIIASDPNLADDNEAWSLAEPVDLDTLFRQSDVVSVHVPLTEDTRSLIDVAALGRMKETAILINTSRGGTVDEAALAGALRDGIIGGAALDVFSSEPLGPEAAKLFADLDNVLLTPHIAGNTAESVDRVATMTVESVLTALGLSD